MRFLVTGGAGLIGSHIAERLLKSGYFVRILDSFSKIKSKLGFKPLVGFEEGLKKTVEYFKSNPL